MKRCLVMIQVAFARQSQQNMEDLIADENKQRQSQADDESFKSQPSGKSKRDRVGPNHNGKPRTKTEAETDPRALYSTTGWKGNKMENTNQNDDSGIVDENIHKDSGRPVPKGLATTPVCSSLDRSEDAETQSPTPSKALSAANKKEEINDLLRHRYREQPAPISEGSATQYVDSMMDSLCLEASMLLLGPHGMALNLSGSQLEAVELILNHQLDAVQKAKTIQSRLRSGLSSPPP